jgi:sialic acid synthase SpsE
MIILEVGINHFGSVKEANYYLDFFLKSKFKYLTFQVQSESFYKKFTKKINFKLPKKFYINAIEKVKNTNKKIGLAVCDTKTFEDFENLNFNFYKLLGVAINNNELIDKLSLKKKKIFISLAKGSDKNILNCINRFKKKTILKFVYTNMSYHPKDLNLSRINYLKNKFKIPVGYGHHYKNEIPLILSKLYGAEFIFLYIKKKTKKRRVYPDNNHAFFLDQLIPLVEMLNEVEILINNKTINTKIKLTDHEIQF